MKKNSKIAIIGNGYVGTGVANFFRKHFDLVVKGELGETHTFPTLDAKHNNLDKNDYSEVNKCDFAVICVPTPMQDNGQVDISIVQEVISLLDVPLILIKSTVPPKTVENLSDMHINKRIVFSPEYMGEGKYVVQWWKDKEYPHPTDMKKHSFQIFGGAKEDTHDVIQFFQRVLGPDVRYLQTDSTTAELTKYMENAWGAMKVTFCHEFHEIAKALGVDYSELRELWLQDGRVERMHTAVFEDDKGFGGKCFPKDVNGIYNVAKKFGVDAKVLKTIIEKNDKLTAIKDV